MSASKLLVPPTRHNALFDLAGARDYIVRRLSLGLRENLLYHGLHHSMDDVLPAAIALAREEGIEGEALMLLETAVLFHDAGYLVQYYQNEAIGARIAADSLPYYGYSSGQIAVICAMIEATRLPQRPQTALEAILCDADLDSLGRADFLETSHNLRYELMAYGSYSTLSSWYARQLDFLTRHAYFTDSAHALRDAGKQANIALLQQQLELGAAFDRARTRRVCAQSDRTIDRHAFQE